MYCAQCGSLLPQGARFCDACGGIVAADASPHAVRVASPHQSGPTPGQALTSPVVGSRRFTRNEFLVLVAMAVVAYLIFHHYTALLAMAFIVLTAVVLHIKRLAPRVKLIVVGAALGVLLVSNLVESYQERREEQKQQDLARRGAAAWAEWQRRQDEAFRRLGPAEHLARARDLVKLGAPQSALDEGFKELDAIDRDAPEYKQGQRLRERYVADKRKSEQAEVKQTLEEARKELETGQPEKVGDMVRPLLTDPKYRTQAQQLLNRSMFKMKDQLAAGMQNSMFDAGEEVYVKATGPNKETIEFSGPLMGALWVHQFAGSEVPAKLKGMGFRRVSFVNSITSEAWSQKLE